jgi:hypothetical protein
MPRAPLTLKDLEGVWENNGRSIYPSQRPRGVPRIKSLARSIEAIFNDVVVEVDEWTSNTDRHPKGVRWRIPGKGRKGTRLRVFLREDVRGRGTSMCRPIFDHRTGDTYRTNLEVIRWILRRSKDKRAVDYHEGMETLWG